MTIHYPDGTKAEMSEEAMAADQVAVKSAGQGNHNPPAGSGGQQGTGPPNNNLVKTTSRLAS